MSYRTFVIGRGEQGRRLVTVLRQRLSLSEPNARRLVWKHHVRMNGLLCTDPARRVQLGQQIQIQDLRKKEKGRKNNAPSPVIRYADAHIVIVDKPAGLTTVRHAREASEFGSRAQRFLPATLADLVPELLPASRAYCRRGVRARVRAVHRLDKDTSGLVVFARTAEAERHLGRQFRTHAIERRYLAVARGRIKPGRIESYLVRDRGDGRRGSTTQPGAGKKAVTHIRVVAELGDFTLVECRLETGRTHQVRIHLGESGTPLCGERVYDRPLHGKPPADTSDSPRLALHAASLGFIHPASGQRMDWSSPLPKDLVDLVRRLRKRAHKVP